MTVWRKLWRNGACNVAAPAFFGVREPCSRFVALAGPYRKSGSPAALRRAQGEPHSKLGSRQMDQLCFCGDWRRLRFC